MDVDVEKESWTWSTGTPRCDDRYHPAAIPAPDSPTVSVDLPSSPRSPGRRPEWESSSDKECEPFRAPVAGRAQYDQLTWDQLHQQRSQRGFRRKESKEVVKTRLASTDAAEARHIPTGGWEQDAPIYADGKGERAPVEGRRARIFPHSSRVRPSWMGHANGRPRKG